MFVAALSVVSLPRSEAVRWTASVVLFWHVVRRRRWCDDGREQCSLGANERRTARADAEADIELKRNNDSAG